MAQCLVFAFLFLALALLPTRTAAAAALTSRDLWQIVMPQKATPDHRLQGVTSTPNMKAYSDGEEGVGGAETRVDFGTKSWPYVYYARRDQKGTVDWGTMSWPYVYYSRRDGKGHKEGKPYNAADAVVTSAVKPATVRHGRKLGRGFRI